MTAPLLRKIDDAAFAEMVHAGRTPGQIAAAMGVTRQAVSYRALALGLRERLRQNKPERQRKPPAPRKPRARKDRYGLPWEVVAPLIERGAVKAFNRQKRGAAKRGIGWEMTFAEWWALWEPHYDERGTHAGQKVMCRTGDVGPYKVGNVRIDTTEANAAERSQVFRKRNTDAGRMPLACLRTPGLVGWLHGRNHVLGEYVEEDGEPVGASR